MLYARGRKPRFTESRLRASGSHVPLRAPARPNPSPPPAPRRRRRRTRVSLPGACASVLATPVVTQAPPPPGSLPEVGDPEPGSATRRFPDGARGSVSQERGLGRGRATFTSAAPGEALGTMAGPQSLALQLEQLLNPRPREADPEAEPEEGEA